MIINIVWGEGEFRFFRRKFEFRINFKSVVPIIISRIVGPELKARCIIIPGRHLNETLEHK